MTVLLKNRIVKKRRAALASGCGVHFLHDGISDSLYVLFPLWAEAFGLSYAQVGVLKSVFSGSLASLQLPFGMLAERWGERALLVAGTLLAGGAVMAFSLTTGFWGLLLCLVVAGLSSGVQHPLASSLVSRAYEGGPRRAALGTYNFAGDMGKVAFPAAIAAGTLLFTWQVSTVSFGLVIALGSIALFVALSRLSLGGPSSDEQSDKTTPAQQPPDTKHDTKTETKGWGLRDPGGFTLLSAIGILDTACRAGFLTFVPFHLITKSMPADSVGFAMALIFGGGAAGKLLCGHLAERVGIVRMVVLTEVAMAGLILAVIYLPLDWCFALLPFLGLTLNGTSSVLYGTVGDFVAPDRHSRAFGLFYTLAIGAGALAPLLFGIISDVEGVETALILIAVTAVTTVPLAFALRHALASAVKHSLNQGVK